MSSFGNTNQEEYGRDLAKRLGHASLEDAIAKITGRPVVRLDVTPFNKHQASDIITKMEGALGIQRPPRPAPSTPDAPANEEASRRRFLTARHLRRIATHQEQPPADLDEDARWVLAALARLQSIEYLIGRSPPTMPIGVNGDNPIETAHLVQYFGSVAAAAAIFGVSEKTFDGWGELVPATHVWRAEIVTGGYVVVPKRPVV